MSDLKKPSRIATGNGYPTIFILDEENRIGAKNLRGKELEKFIEEMQKKKK